MALDLLVDAGLGVQRIERDEGGTIARPDIVIGFGGRMLADTATGTNGRIFLGMEFSARLLLAPAMTGHPDVGFVLMFGSPIGR
jgi:hypothetical protein